MKSVEIRASKSDIAGAPAAFKKHCRRGVGKLLELAEQKAKAEAPVRTGRLSGSSGGRGGISWKINEHGDRIDGNLNATALNPETGENYALFVHEGTGIFGPKKKRITPKNGQALKFKIGGETIFAKSTKGQKPNPFLKRGFEEAMHQAQPIFDREMADFNRRSSGS
jgi:hypothetical protein